LFAHLAPKQRKECIFRRYVLTHPATSNGNKIAQHEVEVLKHTICHGPSDFNNHDLESPYQPPVGWGSCAHAKLTKFSNKGVQSELNLKH